MKRLAIGSIAMIVLLTVMEFVINMVILSGDYKAVTNVWRPTADMMSKMWVLYVVWAVVGIVFTYVFSKGYENKGILEGVRYGAVMSLLISFAPAYAQFVIYPIPYHIAMKWFLFGLAEFTIMGAVLALIFSRISAK